MGTTTLLRLATAGSVDDGKSTLVGRLLHDSKNVLVDQFAAVERASADRGLDGADLALLTDGLRAEREQGITIDVAYRYFATAERSFILADCPGHVQYTRNTVTGASTADVVVLLVDVRHGVLEQTRRHLAVAALLHVPHVIVAVNKVDLVDWDEATYRSVEADVQALAAGLGIAQGLHTIPVSALLGDNIVDRSTNTPWYDGPALLELLEQLPSGEPAPTGTFRFPVQTVIRPQSGAVDPQHVEYRGYAGQVAAGTIAVGDAVTVLPSGRTSTVVGIDLAWTELDSAHAGQSVTVRLADDIDIARGDVLVSSHDAPQPVREIEAVVTWLSDRPLTPGARYDVKHLTTTVKGIVSEVNGRLDLHELAPAPATSLELNDIGRVRIKLAAPLATEDYATSRRTGAFLLIDAHDGATVAAGMIRDRFDGTLR
ncbi:sulfate adenylyltransferase subunit 1 [Kribbia dieselivorans]|uniref:sulfate adenylyltransferase subunit 1 n=1 Tax=Kribbia dieselivorans TaxID=331526 RepID=UPI000838EF01|nr:GTP-binding protein [Kribbia dieselivorans]